MPNRLLSHSNLCRAKYNSLAAAVHFKDFCHAARLVQTLNSLICLWIRLVYWCRIISQIHRNGVFTGAKRSNCLSRPKIRFRFSLDKKSGECGNGDETKPHNRRFCWYLSVKFDVWAMSITLRVSLLCSLYLHVRDASADTNIASL